MVRHSATRQRVTPRFQKSRLFEHSNQFAFILLFFTKTNLRQIQSPKMISSDFSASVVTHFRDSVLEGECNSEKLLLDFNVFEAQIQHNCQSVAEKTVTGPNGLLAIRFQPCARTISKSFAKLRSKIKQPGVSPTCRTDSIDRPTLEKRLNWKVEI